MNETFLVFVVGGVMLGGASLLAARPEAFLIFLIPPGLVTALRLAAVGDEDHLMMGFLAALFTAATLATTWRFHRMIESSLKLRFDNQDLIESLQTAKNHAEALNRDLEIRVTDRTAGLLEADQRKDEFLATLAHELRNPLAAIRFAVESLKAGEPPASAARARDVIDRQVGQLVRLVDDLLDVSRITANKIHLRREPHDLARLMATAVESMTPLSTAADQHLDVRLPSTPIWVEGDGARLVQIFANVLGNAVKFTPRGGQIRFSADQQSDRGRGAHPRYGHRHRRRRPAARLRHVPAGGADSGTVGRWAGHRVDAGAAAGRDARRPHRRHQRRTGPGDRGGNPSAHDTGAGRTAAPGRAAEGRRPRAPSGAHRRRQRGRR